jgi:hypothetical protein
LNAATSRGRALAFWRNGALRPADAWVKALVREYTAGRVEDIGGNPTQGQRSLISTAAIGHAVVALIFRAAAESGGLLGKDDAGQLCLIPAVKELPKFLRIVQGAEIALGVEGRSTPEQDAFELMKRAAIPAEVVTRSEA